MRNKIIKWVLIAIAAILMYIVIYKYLVSQQRWGVHLTRDGEQETFFIVKDFYVTKGGGLLAEAFTSMSSNIAAGIAEESGDSFEEVHAEMMKNQEEQSPYNITFKRADESTSLIQMSATHEVKGKRVPLQMDMRYTVNFSDIKRIRIIPMKLLEQLEKQNILLHHLTNTDKYIKKDK